MLVALLITARLEADEDGMTSVELDALLATTTTLDGDWFTGILLT